MAASRYILLCSLIAATVLNLNYFTYQRIVFACLWFVRNLVWMITIGCETIGNILNWKFDRLKFTKKLFDNLTFKSRLRIFVSAKVIFKQGVNMNRRKCVAIQYNLVEYTGGESLLFEYESYRKAFCFFFCFDCYFLTSL